MLTIVGCGGSETPSNKDGSASGGDVPLVAVLNVPSTPIDFGTVDVGAPASTQTFAVTNAGNGPASAITLTPSAGLTATGCATALAAKATCTVTVSWAPTAATKLNGSVAVAAGTATPVSVAVMGTAVLGADFSVSPPSIPLGNIAVGLASNQTITVKNNKAIALPITVGLTGQDITKDPSSTCGASLAPSASCNLVVVFKAATNGVKSNSVSISGNGVTKEVPISATAMNPAKLGASPTALSLAAVVGSSDSKQVVVVNQGDMSTGIVTAAITGAGMAVTGAPECLAPIAGAKYCTFTVTYSPTTATAVTGTLTVTDPGASSVVVTIAGAPSTISAPRITGSGDFGNVLVGATSAATTLTITNPADAATGPLTLTGPQGVFAKASDTCTGISLAKGATCTVGIQFKPTAVGLVSSLFSVTGAGGTGTLSLSGTGIPGGNLELSPASLDFGNVRVNSSGTARVVTVTNKGGAATGALLFTKTGEHGVFPVTGNTCSASLAPAATCTFTVNFAPIAAGSQNAAILVTDGSLSASLALAGNALAATTLAISPATAIACPVQSEAHGAGCFEQTVVGGSSTQTTFTVSMGTPPAGTTDSGALTVALAGTNPADFTIISNGCTAPLVANGTCIVVVTFTPAATSIGLRQAALNVTSVNGGTATAAIQSVGLSIVEIVPVDASSTVTGLDFGQFPLLRQRAGTPAVPTHTYQVVVRGPRTATSTTTVTAALTNATTPSDFNYLLQAVTNPCTGTVFTGESLTASGPNAGNWSASATRLGMVCSFGVEFYPQTAKGALTATLTASGSAGGSDTRTLTGEATGPLTITAGGTAFPASVTVGDSTNDDFTHITTGVSLTTANNPNLSLTVTNSADTATVGPLSYTLTGTDANQFQVVLDACTARTLAAQGGNCVIVLAFSPTSEGAKTATLTVTGSSETATYVINGNAGRRFLATLTPNGYDLTAPPATPTYYDFGSVVTGTNSPWATFTVTNPAGAATTAQVTYTVSSDSGRYTVDASGAGRCGVSGSTQLAPGASCTINVRFSPLVTDDIPATAAVNPYPGQLNVVTGQQELRTLFTARPATHLTITPATYNFGNVASNATSALVTFTLTNLAPAATTLTLSNSAIAPFSIETSSQCQARGWALAAAGDASGTDRCQLVVRMTGLAEIPSDPISVRNLDISEVGGTSTARSVLTGTTIRPAALVAVGVPSTQTVDLGSITNPRVSAPVTLLIKNTGDVAATGIHFKWASAAVDVAFSDPFRVLPETSGTSCLGLSSLAAGATCRLTIAAEPSATLPTNIVYDQAFTVSADGGLQVTNFTMRATVRQASSAFFDYRYPTASSALQYAFYSFLQVGTGRVQVGQTSTQVVFQLENTSGSTQTVNGSTLVLSDDANWDIALNVGSAPCSALSSGELPTSSSCTFGVTFAPTDAYSATSVYRFATVSLGSGGSAAVLGLVGQVQSPATLALSPTSLDFGQVMLGGTLSSVNTRTLTLTNTGETASATVTLAVGGTNSGDFTATGCAGTVAAGGNCTVSVTVQPTAAGVREGTVTVAGIDANVVATGVIGGDTLSLSPTAYTFADAVEVGATGAATPITVRNLANGRRSGQISIALGGAGASQFVLTQTDCSAATTVDTDGVTGLAGGAECVVTVAFRPTTLPAAPSTVSATLTVSGTPGGTRAIPLTATARSALSFNQGAAALTEAPVTSTFDGTDINVVLASSVSGPTAKLSTSLSGADAASFLIRQNGCLNTQLENATYSSLTGSCTIRVQYIGAATTTTRSAVLTVSDGTSGNTGTVTVQFVPAT